MLVFIAYRLISSQVNRVPVVLMIQKNFYRFATNAPIIVHICVEIGVRNAIQTTCFHLFHLVCSRGVIHRVRTVFEEGEGQQWV